MKSRIPGTPLRIRPRSRLALKAFPASAFDEVAPSATTIVGEILDGNEIP